jgi:peroxiredoxin
MTLRTLRPLVISIALAIGCGHAAAPGATAPAPATVIGVGAKAPDAQLTQAAGTKVGLAAVIGARARSVVVFYRGFWCQTCVRWLGELDQHAAELAQRDIGLIAISADALDDLAALVPKLPNVRLLTDPGLVAASAWGLRVPGAEAPSPGTFVVGNDGVIAWRRLEQPHSDWPTYAELTAALR